MLTLDFIAQRMGGEISANQVKCPGPGHSPKDRRPLYQGRTGRTWRIDCLFARPRRQFEVQGFCVSKIGNAAVPHSTKQWQHQWRRGVAIKDSKGI